VAGRSDGNLPDDNSARPVLEIQILYSERGRDEPPGKTLHPAAWQRNRS
jgi:hypothetical protein